MPRASFLQIAAITIAVRCEDERIAWKWHEPVSRFLVPPQSVSGVTPDLTLDVVLMDASPPPPAELIFDSDAVWRLYRDGDGFRIDCRSEAFGDTPYKIATFDAEFARGTIQLRPDVASLNPLDYPLDEVLVANLLARGRGVELHSCGVIDGEGRGQLFVGVSGAGKTTTARLWEGTAAAIVSDDRVIVRERDGAYWMYGTPWHGEAELSINTGVPLAGVYLLTQATSNALRDLSDAEAVARLFRCTFPLFHDAHALDFTLGFLQRLASRVAVRELQFVRDPSVIELVLGGAAS
ncbi:MAG: hypothetical protein JO197_14370 [Acidobacteria bacterium]|nr:hypothetical protein [Acidobacteriota bacterium]MBV9478730.1 hypothetical protein [Acidobacteriota bacterium]